MKNLHYASLFLGGLLLTSSCVDNDYDLSDIDTSTAIKLDGLVLPVRLNEITLDDVLDVDKDDSIIGIYTDNKGQRYYAIRQDGSFSADPVKINELELKDPVTIPSIQIPAYNGKIENLATEFSYTINNVDPSLLYFSYFGLKSGHFMEISMNITPANVLITDLNLQIPSTYVATYNGQEYTNGIIPVEIENGSLKYPIYVTEMIFNPTLDNVDNTLNIKGDIGIKSANINSNGSDLTIQFGMSPFIVNVVSGSIKYSVDAPYINPVELNDLPDFLTEGETNLILENPQLYLDFSSLYGANYNTDIQIIPEGVDVVETYISLDPFQTSIILAPDAENIGLPNLYSSPVLQDVPQLKYILSGKGLPTKLNVNLVDPYLDGQVNNIVLGTDPGIELAGSYTFFTPLAFGDGSKIIYSKTENDFFGDDMEDVEVKELQLSANVTTNLPFSVKLSVYPLDKDGNILDSASSSIPANAKESLLDIHFTKTFSHLDGVKFIVTADDMNGESLSPEQSILLENIKAKVTGKYVTKL